MQNSEKTVVKGIRASQSFFDKCDEVARKNGMTRNALIVSAVYSYCTKCNKDGVLDDNYCKKCQE